MFPSSFLVDNFWSMTWCLLIRLSVLLRVSVLVMLMKLLKAACPFNNSFRLY